MQWDISNTDLDGDQSVNTFGVSMMESMMNINQPIVEVQMNEKQPGLVQPIYKGESSISTARRIAQNAEVFDQLPGDLKH